MFTPAENQCWLSNKTTFNDDPSGVTKAYHSELQLGWTLYSLIEYRGKNSSRTRPYARAQLTIL